MRASRRNCLYASFVLSAVLLLGTRTHAEKLIIASTPSGATLEIDGAVVGTTPYEIAYPQRIFSQDSYGVRDASRTRHAPTYI
jgi:PEGA domain